jgi:hypothetical protein
VGEVLSRSGGKGPSLAGLDAVLPGGAVVPTAEGGGGPDPELDLFVGAHGSVNSVRPEAGHLKRPSPTRTGTTCPLALRSGRLVFAQGGYGDGNIGDAAGAAGPEGGGFRGRGAGDRGKRGANGGAGREAAFLPAFPKGLSWLFVVSRG